MRVSQINEALVVSSVRVPFRLRWINDRANLARRWNVRVFLDVFPDGLDNLFSRIISERPCKSFHQGFKLCQGLPVLALQGTNPAQGLAESLLVAGVPIQLRQRIWQQGGHLLQSSLWLVFC